MEQESGIFNDCTMIGGKDISLFGLIYLDSKVIIVSGKIKRGN